MKKILVSVLAVAAMVACSTEHTVVKVENNEAIGFDTFVDKTTRAEDITTTNIADFGVYASVTNINEQSGLILTNEKVSKNGNDWVYGKTQYWVPGNSYNFTAIAPFEGRHWTYTTDTQAQNGVINFKNNLENAAGEQDLVFAYAERANVAAGAQTKVGLTFSHLLSKVAFKFTNGYAANDNMTLEVYGIKINNAVAEAEVAVVNGAVKEWEQTSTATFERTFGKQTAEAEGAGILSATDAYTTEHHYLLPIAQQYSITFTIDLYQAGVKVGQYEHTITPDIAFAKGGNYNISATLNEKNTGDTAFEAIEFTVEGVNGWVDNGELALEATTVATADELAAAIAEGGDVRLTSNINLDEVMVTRASTYTYGLFIEKDCVIDGNGYTITTTASRGIAVSGANDVTLKNFTFNSTGERGIQVQGGAKNVTIENVTAVAANYTVNLPSSAGATVVTINNCDLKGLNTVNIGAPGAVVTLNNTTLRSEDNNAAENYSVICVNKDAAGAKVYVNGGEIIVTGTNAEGTNGGSVQCEGGDIIFNGTKGNTTISERKFAIIYGDYWYSYSSLEKAYEKAQAGETIVLLQDATVADGIIVEKNVNFDLNGHTLKYTGDDVLFRVYGAEFTINGTAANSAIVTNPTQHAGESAGNGYVAFVKDNGVVNFNGGSYDAQATCTIAQASANGTVNVYAGEFQVDMTKYTVDGHAQYLLNCSDAAYKAGTAVIKVYGGSFYKFNPANNVAEGANTNFVATGYTVEQNGDWYIVK